VSAGYRSFQAVAVTTRDGGSCCGACRQFLREFLAPGVPLVFTRGDGSEVRRSTMADILPDSFGPENVGNVSPASENYSQTAEAAAQGTAPAA